MVLVDLRYYAKRKRLIVPINGGKEQAIEVILAEQVKELSERARLARGEMEEEGMDGASRPYVSTYSSGGRGPGSEGTLERDSGGDVIGGVASAPPAPTSPLSSANNDKKRLRDVSVGALLITMVTLYLILSMMTPYLATSSLCFLVATLYHMLYRPLGGIV